MKAPFLPKPTSSNFNSNVEYSLTNEFNHEALIQSKNLLKDEAAQSIFLGYFYNGDVLDKTNVTRTNQISNKI